MLTGAGNAMSLSGALWFILMLHIGAGCVAILAGGGALAVRKGERQHRVFGTVFLAAMLAMCAFATYLSVLRQPGTIVGGILTAYLVASAWATVRRAEGRIGAFERIALVVVIACAAGELTMGWLATRSPNGRFLGYPAPVFYVFGGLAALAAMVDIKMIRRGGIRGTARIARHLWRMCTALFIASASFFLGQQKVMPVSFQGSPILVVLGVAPLALMVFWLCRVLLTRAFENGIDSQQRTSRPRVFQPIVPHRQ